MERLRRGPVLGFTYAQAVDSVRGGLSFPPAWPELAAGLAAVSEGVAPAARTAAAVDNGREALTAIACG